MDEKHFLIDFALGKFNLQFNRNLQVADFDIFSILPTYDTIRGYEIFTLTPGDNLRLRIYFNYGDHDGLGDYRLEVDNSEINSGLGDEVFVAIGTVDNYYMFSGMMSFLWIPISASAANILLTEEGDPITTETGAYILL